jgi:DNA polymerase III subunit epsilon
MTRWPVKISGIVKSAASLFAAHAMATVSVESVGSIGWSARPRLSAVKWPEGTGCQLIKMLYVDTETGGTIPGQHALLQVAAIVDIDGDPVDEFCSYLNPFDTDLIEDGALAVNGLTREQIATFPDPVHVHDQFCAFMGKHVKQFDRFDKFYFAAYGVEFDFGFIEKWFKASKDKYLGSYMHYTPPLCLKHWMYRLGFLNKISLPDYKLKSVCDYFHIELGDKAHDALADIRATQKLGSMMLRKMREKQANEPA